MQKKIKTKKVNSNQKRSLSRLMAIQIFYQHNFFGNEKNLDEIKNDVIENYLIDSDENLSSYREKIDSEFLENLLSGIAFDGIKIDTEISEFLKDGWTLAKLDDVTLQILRLGAFELKSMLDAPLKVIINEYVDIAASFFDSKKITFINATLENLAKKFRNEEFKKIKND
jgi:N utilization substance protein B